MNSNGGMKFANGLMVNEATFCINLPTNGYSLTKILCTNGGSDISN